MNYHDSVTPVLSHQLVEKSHDEMTRVAHGSNTTQHLTKLFINLRDYQKEAVLALRENTKGIVAAATGAGKTTMMAASIAEKAVFGRILVLVHLQELVRQTASRIRYETGLNVGEYYAEKRDDLNTSRVMVATWQSMAQAQNDCHLESDHYYAINVDEAHHMVSSDYQAVVDYFSPTYLHGFTATPKGKGEQALFLRFKAIIYSINIIELIKLGYLSPFEIEVFNSNPPEKESDLTSVYHQLKMPYLHQLETKLLSEARTPKILHFFQTNNHIQSFLDSTGIKHAERYTAQVKKSSRTAALESFRDYYSTTRHILTIKMLDEGVDIPAINGLVFHETLGSLRTFIQRLGRGLRIHEDQNAKTYVQQFISPTDLPGLETIQELKREIDDAIAIYDKTTDEKLPISIAIDDSLRLEIEKLLESQTAEVEKNGNLDCICGKCGKVIQRKRVHFKNLAEGAAFICETCLPGHFVQTSCTQCGKPVYVEYEEYRVCRLNGYGHRCELHSRKRGEKKAVACAVCGHTDMVTNGKYNTLIRNNMNYYCAAHTKKHSPSIEVSCVTCGKTEYIAAAEYRNTWASGTREYRCQEHRRKFESHVTVKCVVCGKSETMMACEYRKKWEKHSRPYTCKIHRVANGWKGEEIGSLQGAHLVHAQTYSELAGS